MSISLICKCGNAFAVSHDTDREAVPCPTCKEPVEVPSIEAALGHLVESESARWIRVTCECGKVIKGPRKWAGRTGNCPTCKKQIVMPHAPPEPEAESDSVSDADFEFGPGGDSGSDLGFESDGDSRNEPRSKSPAAAQAAEHSKTESAPALNGSPALAVDAATAPQTGASTKKADEERDTPGLMKILERVEVAIGVTSEPAPPPPKGYHKPPTFLQRARTHVNRHAAGVTVLLLFFTAIAAASGLYSGRIIPLWLTQFYENLTARSGPPTMTLVDAVKASDLDQVKANLKNKSDVNTPDSNGMTPLSAACVRGETDLVGVLLDAGANVAEVSPGGQTPLHWAAGSGRAEVVKLLLQRGADMNAVDRDGRTPQECAKFFGHDEVVVLLAATKPPPAPTIAQDPATGDPIATNQ